MTSTQQPTTELTQRALTALLLLLVAAVAFHGFLFGDRILLFLDIGSDSTNTFFPHLVNFARHVHEGGITGWSFQQGLGQPLLASPTGGSALVFPLAFAPVDAIPWLIAPFEALKLVLIGLGAFCFLRERGAEPRFARIGAVAFATSGYVGLLSSWQQHTTEACFMAWLFFGAERLRRTGRVAPFIAATCLLGLLQPVMAWANVVCCFLWIVLSEPQDAGLSIGLRRWLPRIVVAAAVGIALAGFSVLPNLCLMFDSARGLGGASLVGGLVSPFDLTSAATLSTAWLRSIAADLAGNGDHYRGPFNMLEDPCYAAGLMVLLVIPASWPVLNRAARRSIFFFVLIVVITTVFPWFRRALWVFTGDYYRSVNFAVALAGIALAVDGLRAMENRAPDVRRAIGVVVAVAVAAAPLALPLVRSQLDTAALARVAVAVVAWALVLVTPLARSRYFARAVLVVVVVEGTASMAVPLHARPSLPASRALLGGYNDPSVVLIQSLRNSDVDDGPFRVAKLFSSSPAQHYGRNDAMVHDYMGVSLYSSVNSSATVRVFTAFGLAELQRELSTRQLWGVEDHPLLSGLLGAKYLLAPVRSLPDYVPATTLNGLWAHQNLRALPLVTTYDAAVPASVADAALVADREALAFFGVIVDDAKVDDLGVRRLTAADIPSDASKDAALDAAVAARRNSGVTFVQFGEDDVVVRVRAVGRRVVSFAFPADPGWTAQVDGAPAAITDVQYGLAGVVVDAGDHDVRLHYERPWRRAGVALSVATAIVLSLGLLRQRRRRAEA